MNTESYTESTTVASTTTTIINTNELNVSSSNHKTTKKVISAESSTKKVGDTSHSLSDSVTMTTPISEFAKKPSTRIDTTYEIIWHNLTTIVNTEVYATSTSVPKTKGDSNEFLKRRTRLGSLEQINIYCLHGYVKVIAAETYLLTILQLQYFLYNNCYLFFYL